MKSKKETPRTRTATTKNQTPTKKAAPPSKQYNFKEGNKMYLLRQTDGRTKKYTPEELAEGAAAYFNHTDKNPIYENAIHQRSGEIIKIPRQRPYTIEGLCNYIGTVKSVLFNYENMKEGEARALDYKNIVTRIRQICYAQKLEGAACGIFNSNIIARELGLTDKQEIETTGAKRLQIEVISSNGKAQPYNHNTQARSQTADVLRTRHQPQGTRIGRIRNLVAVSCLLLSTNWVPRDPHGS